jgi:hypothetical protein
MGRFPAGKPLAPSLSKTWNVAKLMSQTSSSRMVISCLTTASRVIVSSDGAMLARDVSLASVNDNPAAPKTGTALIRRFRLEVCDTEILPRLTAHLTLKPLQDTPNELRMHMPPRGKDKKSGCMELAREAAVEFQAQPA